MSKRVSRDLLQLESKHAPSASPFLISPSQAQEAFPAPPAALTHVPIPFPAPTAALPSAASSASASAATGPPRLKTFAIPPSALLSRVQAFLPALALANQKLEQDIALHGAAAVDIENLSTVPAESEGSEEVDGSDGEDDDEEGDSSMSRSGAAASSGMPRHIEMDLSLGVLEAQPHEIEGLDDHEIVIPGIAQPSALRGKGVAAAADSDEDSSDSDEDRAAGVRQHGGILLPAAASSSSAASAGGSKAARKKRKYRVKNKAKLAAAAAAATAASSSAGAPPTRDDTPPLPSPAKGGLIQLMEDE